MREEGRKEGRKESQMERLEGMGKRLGGSEAMFTHNLHTRLHTRLHTHTCMYVLYGHSHKLTLSGLGFRQLKQITVLMVSTNKGVYSYLLADNIRKVCVLACSWCSS